MSLVHYLVMPAGGLIHYLGMSAGGLIHYLAMSAGGLDRIPSLPYKPFLYTQRDSQ